jgi:hypothetical protein
MTPEPEPAMNSVDLPALSGVTIPDETTIEAGKEETIDDVTFTCPAGGAACALSQDADGNVTSTGGAATAALSAEAKERMEQEKQRQAEVEKQHQAEVNALTAAIASRIADLRRPGGENPLDVTSMGVMTVDGDKLGVNDVHIKNANEFQIIEDKTRGYISGFTASVHGRMKSGKTDTLTIYSDREPPKAQMFNEYYKMAEGHPGINMITADTTLDDSKTFYSTLKFDVGAMPNSISKHMKALKIPAAANRYESLKANEKFRGTFHGIPGIYTCSGGDPCKLKVNGDNVLNVVDEAGLGSLTFKPDPTVNDTEDVHMIQGVILDKDFLSFGYWLQGGTGQNNEPTFAVNAFYAGSKIFDDNLTTLKGSATYRGSATGLYAKKALGLENGKITRTPNEAGQFTANANLMVHFGAGGTVGDGETNRITGTIDKFLDRNGTAIADDWSLSLNAPAGTNVKQNGGNSGPITFSGMTGSGQNQGKWSGQFFGVSTTEGHPTSAAGKFTGHFDDGHVIGAFGATRE